MSEKQPAPVHLHTVGLWEPTTSPKLGQQPVLQVDDRLPDLFVLGEEVIVIESDLQVLLQGQSAGQLEHPAGVGADVRTTPAPSCHRAPWEPKRVTRLKEDPKSHPHRFLPAQEWPCSPPSLGLQ